MDAETKRRVEKTVVVILEKADMTEMTEFKVRSLASERLGIDLSGSREVKKFGRGIVENFLASRAAQADGGGTAGKRRSRGAIGRELDRLMLMTRKRRRRMMMAVVMRMSMKMEIPSYAGYSGHRKSIIFRDYESSFLLF